MREILFRGKSLDKSGEWVLGSLIHRTDFYGDPCDDYFILYGGEFDCDYYDSDRVNPETVGQFTGLTDKNGKKIFEGDILKWDDIEWGSEHLELVEWNYSLFSIRKDDWNEWCEVVGNIHDNPELLKNEHTAIL